MVQKGKATKRAVNLSLTEDVVAQASDVTDNLSELVESLLRDFVSREKARRAAHGEALGKAIAAWNTFGEEHGSFADEHSTL